MSSAQQTVAINQMPAKEVADKLAATQELEKKQIEVKIATAEAQRKVEDAKGIAESMEIINKQLTSEYIQYLAIEAQKEMVNSPNNTVVYIPSGNMGVPLVKDVNPKAKE